ncbi:MAG: xanthine dehydrogenase family protein subunit M [Caldilineaceae bacterium]|nr:xanthine dehydrogenase family protein subunit M [Caldilineaceae bacterium]
MRPFAYSSARSMDDAIDLLSTAQDGEIRLLAGGTDLLTLMKADIVEPCQLVDIKRLDELPGGIEETSQGVTLGALTTLAEIEQSDLLQQRYPLLTQAAGLAATPQLRNMATLGGNLLQRPRCWYYRSHHFRCWLKGGDQCQAHDGQNQFHALFGESPCVAVHPSDLAGALLAVDAEVRLCGAEGERTLPLADFFVEPAEDHRRETTLRSDELIVSIYLPTLPASTRSVYLKAMDRAVWAFALVGVAAVLHLDGDRIAHARLVLNGVASIPWRAESAERALIGERPDEAIYNQAADLALRDAVPLEHNGYKVTLTRQLIRRALAMAES